MKKKAETIKYQYPFSKEQFLQACQKYCAEHIDQYLFEQIDEDHFRLGVARGGHSGGYWYVAAIEGEKNIEISGEVKYISLYDKEYTKKQKILDAIGIMLFVMLLLPVVLFALIISRIYSLFSKKPKTPKDKLDHLMIDIFCCKQADP